MGTSINIETGKNYLINCNKDSTAIDYIKSLVPDTVVIVQELKEILGIEESRIKENLILLVLGFEKLNLIEFDKVMKLAYKGIKKVSVIGICKEGALKSLILENFSHIQL